MRLKHVFELWIIADLILAIGGIVFGLIDTGGDVNAIGFAIMIGVFGMIVSLPSLIAMLIFHSVYYRSGKDTGNYVQVYIIVILVINALYLLITELNFDMEDSPFDYLYIATTVAGLISLFIVDRRIKKVAAALEEGNLID
jgi:fumarate reductase subunit D